jgi:hypothetical protein
VKITDSLFDYAVQAALAASGGFIGILMRGERGGWPHVLLGATGAGFVGLLVAHGCHALGLSDDYTFVCVGVAGWLGADRTITYLERILLNRFKIDVLPATGDADNVRQLDEVRRKRGEP